jgi:hypothetical protein
VIASERVQDRRVHRGVRRPRYGVRGPAGESLVAVQFYRPELATLHERVDEGWLVPGVEKVL